MPEDVFRGLDTGLAISRKEGGRKVSALEFLMTYGWAILVVIIALVAIGRLSQALYKPQQYVILNPPFHAGGMEISPLDGNEIKLQITNQMPEDLTLERVVITGCGEGKVGAVLTPQENLQAKITCESKIFSTSDNFKGNIQIYYRKQGSSLSLLSEGTLSTSVKEANG